MLSENKCNEKRRFEYGFKKNTSIFHLCGKTVIDFWTDTTKDGGLCFGPTIPNSDIHLTVLQSKGKLRHHIKHKRIKEPPDESPVGGQISTRQVTVSLGKMLLKRLATYHGNKTCWAFTPARWERIQSRLPKADLKGNLYVALEFLLAQLDMNFSKKKLWKKVHIRSLLASEPHFGYLQSKQGLRMVTPISKNQMLTWPLSKSDEIQKYFSKVIGIDNFFEYLDSTEEGRKLSSEIKRHLMQLSTS